MAGSKSGDRVRVALGGLGTIGGSVARLLVDHRVDVDVVAAATQNPDDIGRYLKDVAGTRGNGPQVVGSLAEMLRQRPDVVILATGSFISDALPQVLECVEAGANVISPCEQLAYPFSRFPKESAEIDKAARAKNVTVLGTGINPGLIFDALVAAASGVCWDVTAISGRRVVDTTGFGEIIHHRLGIGYTAAEFEEGRRTRSIAGHVGFPESIEIVCERLGVSLDGPVEESLEPLIARTPAPTKYGAIPAGSTEGLIQRALGRVNGTEFMRLELVLHLRPKEAGFVPADTFTIDGRHPVHLTLDPGLDPVPATAAQLVNSIPAVLRAEAGLKTVKDIPAPAAWLGDLTGVGLR
jgi:4-hydroxy-tetrahydrodipicolinate reductase